MAHSPAEIQDWLLQEFSARLIAVIEGMGGERPVIEIQTLPSAPVPSAAPDNGLCWRQPFSGLPGPAWLIATEADWASLGSLVLSGAGIDDSDAASQKSTYLETVGQTMGGIAQAMSARLGREILPADGSEATGPPDDLRWAAVRLNPENGGSTLALGFETGMLEALMAVEPKQIEDAASETDAAETTLGFGSSKTFGLLLDVELPVSVSFGRAQVALKDVLKLTTGSIVELNRAINEPVEVIVNNCVIARGEVVVIEGNFGVVIQQVISHQERLRTLN